MLASGESKKFLGEEGLSELISLVKGSTYSSGGGTTSGHTGACKGVYIAYVDYDGVKRICTASDWSDSNGAAQGVMIGDGTHELLVSPTESTKMYGMFDSLVGGVITTKSSSNVVKDFNRKLNTIAYLNSSRNTSSTAFLWCYEYSYGVVGASEWWLPSFAELALLRNYLEDINDALQVLGMDNIIEINVNGFYVSSTQRDETTHWGIYCNNGAPDYVEKNESYNVRAVAAFDYEL